MIEEILLMNWWNKIVMTIGVIGFALVFVVVVGCLLWVFFGEKK